MLFYSRTSDRVLRLLVTLSILLALAPAPLGVAAQTPQPPVQAAETPASQAEVTPTSELVGEVPTTAPAGVTGFEPPLPTPEPARAAEPAPEGPVPGSSVLDGLPPAQPLFELPSAAESIEQLVPARQPLVAASDDDGGGAGLRGEGVRVAQSARVARSGGAVTFLDEQVAVVVHPDTFTQTVRLALRQSSELRSGNVPTDTLRSSRGGEAEPGPEHGLIRFELEALDEAGQPITTFARPVYLVVDLRGFPPEQRGQGWYLAYRDPQDPSVWRSVETQVLDPEGLIAARVDHFSAWSAGAEDVGWVFQWQEPTVSTFSGAATFQYPVEVPPGRGGLQPSLDMSYSSRGVDGNTFSNMNQGLLGLGWSMSTIEIAREGVRVEDNQTHKYLVHPEAYSLVLDGVGYELRTSGPVNSSVLRYYATNAPQLYIERRYDAATPNVDKVYWIVKTQSGTTYRLGYYTNSESGQSMASGMIQNASGCDWGSTDFSGIRWLADTVTDVYGNQVQYDYATWEESNGYESESHNWTWSTTSHRHLSQVRYNYASLAPNANTRATGSYASRIDLIGTADHRLDRIDLYQLGTRYRIIDVTSSSVWHHDCGQSIKTQIVESIAQYDGTGTTALPAVTFNYTTFAHTGSSCFQYEHLWQVDNGYGGVTRFTYGLNDNRVDDSPALAPAYGRTYLATRQETWDGVNAQPAVVEYQYATPCYDQHDTDLGVALGSLPGAFNCPTRDNGVDYGHNNLVGFASTTRTVWGYGGEFLGRQRLTFSQARATMGRSALEEALDAGSAVLRSTQTTYLSTTFGATTFSYASQVVNIEGSGAVSSTTRVEYRYEPENQGNQQYGMLTRVSEFDENNVLRRITFRQYHANPTRWVIVPWAESILDGSSVVLGKAFMLYDGQTDPESQVIDRGQLRLQRQVLWEAPGCAPDRKTVDVSYTYDAYGNPRTSVTYADYGLMDCSSNNWAPDGAPGHESAARPMTTTYDTAYNLYPLSVCNVLGQCATTEYYGVNGVGLDGGLPGQVRRTWDANSTPANNYATAVRYTYDTLGRTLAVAAPFDNPSVPTVSYSYTTLGDRVFYDDFESGCSQYGNLPAGWSSWDIEAYCDNTDRYGGTWSARLRRYWGDPNAEDYRAMYRDISLQANTSYLVRFAVKGSGHVKVSLSQGSAWYNLMPSRLDATGTWRIVEGVFRTGATAGNYRFHLWVDDADLRVDQVEIYRMSGMRVIESRREVSGQGATLQAVRFYDGLGRVIQERSETQDGAQQSVVNMVYDGLGRVQYAYAPALESFSWTLSRPSGWDTRPRTSTQYDPLGRTSQTTGPDGTSTIYDHGVARNSTDPDFIGGRVTVTTRDANGHFVRQSFDAFGNLQTVSESTAVWPSWGTEQRTRYTYDVLGNLTQVRDAVGNITTMAYDGLGRKTGMTDPDMGTWQYTYYAAGTLHTQTDARGCVTTFNYDSLNRLTSKTYSGPLAACNDTPDVSYSYDAYVAPPSSPVNYGRGYRTGMTDGTGSTAWRYDARGRVVEESKSISDAGAPFVTFYTYDAMDRVTSTTYPDNEVVATTYNAQGLPAQLRSNTYSYNYASGLTYNAMGQPTQMSLGNGLLATWGYFGLGGNGDANPSGGLTNYGRLWRIRTRNATGEPLQDLRYNYDAVGNVNRWIDVPRSASGWPGSCAEWSDTFNSKDSGRWTWSSHQTVPYNDAGNNVVKNTGTGNWDARFYRSSYNLTSGMSIQVRFKLDRTDSGARFAVESSGTYRRFGVVADQGKLYVQYNNGPSYQYPADLITNLQTNTWYVLRIMVDDSAPGFVVEAYQESNPSVYGRYSFQMAAGQSWRFMQWIYQGSAYVDDYQEFTSATCEPFNNKNTANWTWNAYQTVPHLDGGNNVARNTGTGASWDANFYRSSYSLDNGEGIQLRFKVSRTDTAAHFAIENSDSTYRRFGVVADGGKLYVQYRDDGATWRYPADLITNLQTNTWYVLRIVVDEARGFYVEAYQENSPSVRGSYNVWMPANQHWRFHHWTYRGTVDLDDYREFSTAGLSWTPDERMGFTYDALDRLTNANPVNGGQGYTAAYTYNPIGNMLSRNESGASWSYTYGNVAHRHAVTSLSNGWSFEYDANGNMVTRRDAESSDVIDNFEYIDSPLNHHWSIYTGSGTVSTVSGAGRPGRVLRTTSTQGTGFGILYPSTTTLTLRQRGLSLWIKDTDDFGLYVLVRAMNGQDYYLSYRPISGTPYPSGNYAIIPVGTQYRDGTWRELRRNMDDDLQAVFGVGIDYVRRFYIRGTYDLDDLTLFPLVYTHQFDAENRLTSVTVDGQTTTFYYDGDGNRVKKVQNGQTTVYVGEHYEKNLTANQITKYYYLGGQRVAMRQGGVLYYLHADHLGSASLTTNSSGAVVARQLYYPYGSTRWTSNALPTDRRFTGQQWEGGIGLYDYNARWYHPYLNRFVSPDTIIPNPAKPQSLNRYSYVYNNPYRST